MDKNTTFYGIVLIDCLGVSDLKYITADKETALEGVKLLQKNYKYSTAGPIFLIEYNSKELISVNRHRVELNTTGGEIIGRYSVKQAPGVLDEDYRRFQEECKAFRESTKVSLQYEGTYGGSILLRLSFGGLIDREKLYKKLDKFIGKFNNN